MPRSADVIGADGRAHHPVVTTTALLALLVLTLHLKGYGENTRSGAPHPPAGTTVAAHPALWLSAQTVGLSWREVEEAPTLNWSALAQVNTRDGTAFVLLSVDLGDPWYVEVGPQAWSYNQMMTVHLRAGCPTVLALPAPTSMVVLARHVGRPVERRRVTLDGRALLEQPRRACLDVTDGSWQPPRGAGNRTTRSRVLEEDA